MATNRSSYAYVTEPIDPALLGPLRETMVWESARPYLYLRATGDHRLVVGGEDDAIDIPYHGVPTASLWQCGLLIKEMAALAEQGGEERSGSRGEALAEMDQHLHKTWQREGCSRLTDMQ